MTHIITSLCLRDSACIDVCPVECIVPGKPEEQWPWMYIDPDTCIDCGACIPECPYEAIFPEDEVPEALTLKAGQYICNTKEKLADGEALDGQVGTHHVKVLNAKLVNAGDVVNLREDIQPNYDFYKEGPGYKAKDM
ncbi:MAG TPA: ferredoxin family protein [Anaerolineae bacterium]